MSEAKFFPLKKFLIVNRGDEIPENVTVLCDGGRELVIKHANSFEARRELQYQAKLLGANALLNVHVDWFSPGDLTRYLAYGAPAVCGRKHFKGTMTADELRSQLHMPPPPPPTPAPARTAPGPDPWMAIAKFFKYAFVAIIILLVLNLIS